jgi:hypothetical protein
MTKFKITIERLDYEKNLLDKTQCEITEEQLTQIGEITTLDPLVYWFNMIYTTFKKKIKSW